jgi:SAM-dependent methyltransferase
MLDLRDLLTVPALYRIFADLLRRSDTRRRIIDGMLKVKPRERVLDVGCGPADWLSAFPDVDYYGVDISPQYIEAARGRYRGKGHFAIRAITDATSFDDLGKFDLVMALGLIHHLSDSQALSLMHAAKMALNPGGRFVTLDNVFVPDQSRVARWIIDKDRGQHIRSRDGYAAIARRHFEDVRVIILHDLLRIPYTHIIMECR